MNSDAVFATKWYNKLWRWLVAKFWFFALYFTAQQRFERAHLRRVVTPAAIAAAKKGAAQHWQAKKEKGRLLIQHGGTITAPPFPPRGSLLTEDERNDPLAR